LLSAFSTCSIQPIAFERAQREEIPVIECAGVFTVSNLTSNTFSVLIVKGVTS